MSSTPLAPCPKPLFVHALAATATAMLLAGCGGGGSGGASAPAAAPPPLNAQAPAPAPAPASNKAPVGDAGKAQVARVGTASQLDGSASKDEDGDTLSYAWTLTSKPAASNATIADSTAIKPSFTPDVAGTYVASLVVSDGKTSSAVATVNLLAEAAAFDSVAAPFPPNMASYGFEAKSLVSLGDKVTLAAGTPRLLRSVTVAMSSWACQTGSWDAGTCASAANATFDHPVTIRLLDASGHELTTLTKTFAMPYRPTADATCTDPKQWRAAADNKCYNGFAFKLNFDLSDLKLVLPDTVIYEVAYNTQHRGAAPTGVSGPYDSLNVGVRKVSDVAPSVGTDFAQAFNRQNGNDTADGYSPMAQIVVTAP
ncbi:PKD domain-containing protein [Variovorax sp. OV329]|uniref:PKD domain-containing protein n=1 Tax=Variovorax sp. OV329 TaxID=1882825 RepID=UPI0008F35A0C|nr:PKD domain-containing protein [Variovorax sp. OV329]SFL89050.1 hypothetical protein SAMN05444747_101150 [Variovorax sp. OV329]